MISRYKPLQPILAFTFDEKTYNQLNVVFGVTPILIPKMKDFEEAKNEIKSYIKKNKLAKKNNKIIIASALPFGKMTETIMMVVETI